MRNRKIKVNERRLNSINLNRIKTLVNKNQVAGFRSIKWDATNNKGHNVSAGVYLYKIETGKFTDAMKMILLK